MNKRASSGLLVVVVATVAIPAAAHGGQTGASEAIVFERKGDLFVMAVDGSRTIQLTKTSTLELEPAVSPNGRSIAYVRRGLVDTSFTIRPPAKDLAAVLGVNTNTVLRSLRLLRDEGLLEFRRGRGISVAGTPERGAVVQRARELPY